MTNVKIATSAEQPINRHAAVAGQEIHEGDLVGIDANGQMVPADPEGVMALGVCMTPADDLSNYTQDEVRLVVQAERALVDRDRVTATSNGVEVENGDGDWAFTPGLPVYMGAGGEYTQTAPGVGGVQVVGSALTEDRIRLDVRPSSDF